MSKKTTKIFPEKDKADDPKSKFQLIKNENYVETKKINPRPKKKKTDLPPAA